MVVSRLFKSIKSIDEIFESDNELSRFKEAIKNYEVLEEFENIFPDLAKVAKAKKIEKKVLFIKVEDSTWRNELRLNQSIIIEKINKHYKKEIVKYLKFL